MYEKVINKNCSSCFSLDLHLLLIGQLVQNRFLIHCIYILLVNTVAKNLQVSDQKWLPFTVYTNSKASSVTSPQNTWSYIIHFVFLTFTDFSSVSIHLSSEISFAQAGILVWGSEKLAIALLTKSTLSKKIEW